MLQLVTRAGLAHGVAVHAIQSQKPSEWLSLAEWKSAPSVRQASCLKAAFSMLDEFLGLRRFDAG
jgi:hypothetical protein